MTNGVFARNSGRWVLDGGMATELEGKGFDLNHPLWSALILSRDPQSIYQVHKSYLQAGANVILTCSYQASVGGFQKYLEIEAAAARELIFSSVKLAYAARADFLKESKSAQPILIGASVGPYGAILADGSEYRGDYDLGRAEVREYYSSKISELARNENGVRADFIAFETIPTAAEARLISSLMGEHPSVPFWLSFSRAEALLEALPELNENSQIHAVGLNCVEAGTIGKMLPMIREGAKKPIVVYPNGGGSYDAHTKTWSHDSHGDVWLSEVSRWSESGARIIGGCCRTGPREIRAISESLDMSLDMVDIPR